MSGRSQSVTVDPQGWISSAADCTSAISPSKSRMLISASGSAGSLTRTILRLSPFQACFWKNVCPPIPSGQRTNASARPTIKRLHERPSLGVVIGEAFLGDANVRPIDAIGMGQRHAALRAFRRGVRGHGRLTHNLTRRLVIAQALKGRLTQQAVSGPAAEIDLRDQLRPNIADLARFGRGEALGERTRANAHRVEPREQRLGDAGGKAGADASDITQVPRPRRRRATASRSPCARWTRGRSRR